MILIRLFLLSAWPFTAGASTLSATSTALTSAELLRVLSGLLIVVAAIVLLSWLLRRLNGARLVNFNGLRIIACMNLGTREKIMLVNVGNRYLLIGVTSGSINTLHDYGEELPAGFSLDSKTSFSDLLKKALGKS